MHVIKHPHSSSHAETATCMEREHLCFHKSPWTFTEGTLVPFCGLSMCLVCSLECFMKSQVEKYPSDFSVLAEGVPCFGEVSSTCWGRTGSVPFRDHAGLSAEPSMLTSPGCLWPFLSLRLSWPPCPCLGLAGPPSCTAWCLPGVCPSLPRLSCFIPLLGLSFPSLNKHEGKAM